MKFDFTKIHHTHILFSALGKGLLFITGFMVYELTVELEDKPHVSQLKTLRSKFLKFIIIVLLASLISYALYFATSEYY